MPNEDAPAPAPTPGPPAHERVVIDAEQAQARRDEFAARTAAVEDLDLPDRADAFSALHDELRTRLESGGTASA